MAITPQKHLSAVPSTWRDMPDWIRRAATTINGILGGGPFPYLWRDNIAMLSAAKLGASNQPTWISFIDGLDAYSFSKTTMGEVFVCFHIDHDYALGTKIYPHIHWTSNSVDTGTARWGFEYSIARGHQQEAFPSTTTIYVEQAFTGTAYTHMIGEVSDGDAIDGEALSIEPDTLVMMRAFRDAAHANDTFDDEAFGLFVDLHYQAERRGTANKAPNFYEP